MSNTTPPPVKRPRLTQADTQTGPPRRSARLHARQLFADRTESLEPCSEPQVEAGARSASKRTALQPTNTQQSSVDREETSGAAKTERQPKPLERPYTSLSEPKVVKKYPNESYYRVFNQEFTGFPKDAGFNNGLVSAPQPGFVEGLEMEEFRPFPIDDHLDWAILCKDDPNSVALPHLAGEWKGRGKDMEEARLQSAYDGAALVYGRSQALDSIGKPYLAGHAKVITFTTDGTTLNFFAHYAGPSEDGTPEYHQYPITSTNVKNSHQEFRQGYRQLRNAQDYAREESYELRDKLKEYWKAGKSQPAPDPLPKTNIGTKLSARTLTLH